MDAPDCRNEEADPNTVFCLVAMASLLTGMVTVTGFVATFLLYVLDGPTENEALEQGSTFQL